MKDSSRERLATALRRFALERHRYLNQLARSEHLTRAEFDALDFIQQAGRMMPTELADRLALTTGAVTAVLDRLEKHGLVERSRNPKDRRSVVVRQTARADSTGKAAIGPYVRLVAGAAKQLSPADRETVTRFLDSVTEELLGSELDDIRTG